MRKLIVLSALLTSSFWISAQQEVYFRILHHWDNQTTLFNHPAITSEGEQISLTRVEYYISGISLTHDGGQVTNLDTVYILANANYMTEQFLGTLNITQLESVSFAIGVDSAHNHLDPAQYNFNHPLALHNPSMHWGWTGGYRFLALEGEVGNGSTAPVEIHALGDANYHFQTVSTQGAVVGGNLIIQLDAEYLNGFNSISVAGGAIEHSEVGKAAQMLTNYSTDVFSASTSTVFGVSIEEEKANKFVLQPNPAVNNTSKVCFGKEISGIIQVIDLTGRIVLQERLNQQSNCTIKVPIPGVYLVQVHSKDVTASERWIVN